MNIVLIRATSGAGKTFIAEQVIARAGGLAKAHTIALGPPDKPQAKWKTGAYVWDEPPLVLMGRYEAACGGCDTLNWRGAADDVEAVIMDQAISGRAVLLEGLMVSSYGVERLKRMNSIAPLTVVYLTTPLADCISSVKARRAAIGNTKPLNEDNTRAKHHTLTVTNRSNRKEGIVVEELGRDAALPRVMELLGL